MNLAFLVSVVVSLLSFTLIASWYVVEATVCAGITPIGPAQ